MKAYKEGIGLYCEDVAISWDLKDNKVFKARTVALLYQLILKYALQNIFKLSRHIELAFFLS